MRIPIVVAASLFFVVAPAFAQQRSTPNSVSLFVSDLALSDSSSRGFRSNAGFGAAFDHMFNDRVSVELSVSRQTIRRYVSTFVIEGPPVSTFREFALYPIDANVSYHFITGSRWKPYIGAGLRYVSDSEHFTGLLGGYDNTSRAIAPEVSGGVTFALRPNLGVRVDAKEIVGGMKTYVTEPVFKGSDALSFVPAFQASVGLSFRF